MTTEPLLKTAINPQFNDITLSQWPTLYQAYCSDKVRFYQWLAQSGGISLSPTGSAAEGWSNLVLVSQQDEIIRLPKFPAMALGFDRPQPYELSRLAMEKAFLNHFASVSSLAIPQPKSDYCKLREEQQDRLMHYPRLAGNTATVNAMLSLPTRNSEAIGRFLAMLHSTRFDHAQLVPYPYGDGEFLQSIWPCCAPLLSPSTGQKALAYCLDGQRLYKGKTHICHGDFGLSNLLMTRVESAADSTQEPSHLGYELTGVIDFSDLCLGDVAMDFALLNRKFPPAFINQCLDTYRKTLGEAQWHAIDPDSLFARIEYHSIRKALFVIFYAATYGPYLNGLNAQTDFDSGVKRNIEFLETFFAPTTDTHNQ